MGPSSLTSEAVPASDKGMNENGLIERAREGDRAAFGELVRQHRDAVYRFAVRWVADPDQALDIAQEVFVRAFDGHCEGTAMTAPSLILQVRILLAPPCSPRLRRIRARSASRR